MSRPGEEPQISEVIGSVEEDMSLVDGDVFADLPSAKRVMYLSKRCVCPVCD